MKDCYVQIETPMNMFPDKYLFRCINGNEPKKLRIIVTRYVHNDNDIIFQVEVVKENEVK